MSFGLCYGKPSRGRPRQRRPRRTAMPYTSPSSSLLLPNDRRRSRRRLGAHSFGCALQAMLERELDPHTEERLHQDLARTFSDERLTQIKCKRYPLPFRGARVFVCVRVRA